MKKILLLLLLATFSIQAQTLQNPTYGNVKLKNNTTDNSATKVNVQSTDGTINTISKSDLVNVVEVNDVPSLPLIGEAGKIYVVKNLNKIYRWNGTIYQELAVTDISGKINVSEKGVTVATLEGGKIPNSQIPALAISETFPVSSQAQMLALSQADQGDVAIRSDISKSFILRVSPSSVLANWSELLSPTDAVTSVNGQVGVVTLAKSDVGLANVDNTTDLLKPISTATQTALNLKENTFSKNTAFNKNFGTTAGTVVEGGTLGTNAYTSTAYLPLTGGILSGDLTVYKASGVSNLVTRVNETYGIFFNNGANVGIGTNDGSTGNKLIIDYRSPDNSLTFDINGKAKFISTVEASPATTDAQVPTLGQVKGITDLKAPLASPALTGTPTAPTAPAGTNTTQIATTAFVLANGGATSGSYTPTFTNGTNVTSVTNEYSHYTKIGNIVTVFVNCTLVSTTANTLSDFRISLPFSTTNPQSLVLLSNLSGNTGPTTVPAYRYSTAATYVSVRFKLPDNTTATVMSTFSYSVN